MNKNRILVLVGSNSDRPQLTSGLAYLVGSHKADYLGLVVASIHRNTEFVLALARVLAGNDISGVSGDDYEILRQVTMSVGNVPTDIVIAGAGWANHLTGTFDAYLRHKNEDRLNREYPYRPVVVGFAIEDPKNPRHTEAAVLSMTEVPNTQVKYSDESGEIFVRPDGFRRACEFAVNLDTSQLDSLVTIPQAKPVGFMDPAATAAWLETQEGEI